MCKAKSLLAVVAIGIFCTGTGVNAQNAPSFELTVNDGVRFISKSAISPDEKYFVVASALDRVARVWDFRSGRVLRTIANVDSPTALRFSNDSLIFALASNSGEVGIFDVRSTNPIKVLKGHTRYVWTLDFSADGRTLVSGSYDGTIKIWDVSSGRQISSLSGSFVSVDIVRYISISKFVAVTRDGKIRLWEVGNPRAIWTLDFAAEALAVSADGNSLAIINDVGSIKILDAKTGKTLQDAATGEAGVKELSFLNDGKIVAASGKKGPVFWNIGKLGVPESPRLAFQGGREHDPLQIPFASPTGRRFFLLWGDAVVETDTKLKPFRRILTILSSMNPGSSADPFVANFIDSKFAIRSAQLDLRKTVSQNLSGKVAITFVGEVSDDGRIAILRSGASGAEATVWEISSTGERQIVRLPLTSVVNPARLSRDGRFVAYQEMEDNKRSGPIALSRIGMNSSVKTLDLLAIRGKFVFSNDGNHLGAVTSDGYFNLYDTETGNLTKRFSISGNAIGNFGDFGLSPDGSLVGIGGQTNQIWDVRRGSAISTLQNSAWAPSDFAISRDGLLVASTSPVLQLWEARSGRLLMSSINFPDKSWVTITPEGFFDASDTGSGARNLNVVRGLEVSSIDQVYNALYRPDLVREKLAGDPDGKVKAAAAKLDLNKVMASGSAPKVAITSPTAGSSSATDEVAVEATVSDQGGGIGKVEWRVNGVTSGIETRGLERVEAAASTGRSLTVKRSLALERGENRIEVLGYNAKDLIASEPASVTVSWDGEKTATPPKLYVMAVGVNDYYDSRLRLSHAVPDATAIAEGFRKAGAGLYAAVDITTVLDKDVTIANLDKVFTELGKKAQPRDVFVFFLAGHGKTKNGRYYFLPRDFRYEDEDSIEKSGMDQDKFQAWFARIPARKSILLYDTCESGSLTGTKARGSDIDERLGALNRMTRATGRTFLTATTDDAPALEGYRGHGVFTYALLDALDHADVNKNGLIEVSELADYIDQKVPDFSFEAFKLRQIPQRSIVGNNFALTNKMVILTAATDANANAAKVIAAVPVVGTGSSGPAIPTKPTHVVTAPADVFIEALGKGERLQQLPAGTLLFLLKTEEGWALVAKDGKRLGYVAENHLIRVQ
jgi:WD40 repeat protein/uncharacterized caspase-like protein